MEEEFRERAVRAIKLRALLGELGVLISIIVIVVFLADHQIFEMPGFSCSSSMLETAQLDLSATWGKVITHLCAYNYALKLVALVAFPYLFLCALLVCSPLKTTPSLYFSGVYFLNEKGEAPQFHEAFKLVFFSMNLLPLYFLVLYCYYIDFTLNLHQSTNVSFLFAGLVATLLFIETFFGLADLVWDERVSGLRFHLTEKKKAKIAKQVEKQNRRYCRFFYRVRWFEIGVLFGFIIWGGLAFNVLRQGSPPDGYDTFLYKREAPVWENNAYFALAGLNAPEEIRDYYAYGLQEVVYNSERFTRHKEKVGIPYTHDVPDIEITLYEPGDEDNRLRFNSNDLERWDCLYNLRARSNTSACPSKEEVLKLIELNPVLWRRFRGMTAYPSFSIPDYFLDMPYSGQDLITLSRLNSVYILELQAQGKSDEAMREWLDYMRLNLQMVHVPSPLVEKAVLLVVLKIHGSVLETLLYNEPELAVEYGEQIKELLDIDDVNYFRGGYLVADDWRMLEPWMLPTAGSLPHKKRLLYKCFKENERIAALPANELFQMTDYKFCNDDFSISSDFIQASIVQPGNYVTNIIFSLLMGGVVKGSEMIWSMHKEIADYKMALIAVELIKNKIAPDDVQGFVKALPEEYLNPITASPFLWDKDKQMLYYLDPAHPELEPSRGFRVNLSSY